VKNSKSKNKLRITFDYSRVNENLLDIYVELFSKIYDYLFDSRHKYLFVVNLKYIYYTIFLYLENKHYFVFTISKIEQL